MDEIEPQIDETEELPLPSLEIGQYAKLLVERSVDFGYFLDAQNLGEILLPLKYAPHDLELGDMIDVFLYLDSEDRPVATTETPIAVVGEFASLKVVSVTDIGAFMDWGLVKDLFIPKGEQRVPLEEGNCYTVYLMIDHTGRICGSTRIKKYISTDLSDLKENDPVKLLIHHKTRLGYQAIVDNRYRGILYSNEIFQNLRIGQHIDGFVKKVREDDKLDLILQLGGYDQLDDVAQKVLDTLKKSGGKLTLTDKSTPSAISHLFSISKKRYKMALGKLYKQRLISIEADGITLLPEADQT